MLDKLYVVAINSDMKPLQISHPAVELQRVEKAQFIPGNKPGFLGRKF